MVHIKPRADISGHQVRLSLASAKKNSQPDPARHHGGRGYRNTNPKRIQELYSDYNLMIIIS